MTHLKKYFCLILFLFIIAAFLSCAAKEKKSFTEKDWKAQVDQTDVQNLYAPHIKDGRYYAPWMAMPDKSFLDVLAWKFFESSPFTKEEKSFLPKILPDTARRAAQADGDFILWIGHNTFLIRIDHHYWLTDPIFSKRALLPERVTPPAMTIEELNALAKQNLNVVISHNHYDHLDRSSIRKLDPAAVVFVPKGLKNYVEKMSKKTVHELDWWQRYDLGNGSTLVCLPAQHWSLRINQGRNKSLWASWLLITSKATLYFGGDSGYFKGFEEIGKKYPGIDYAFMATTAYHPRWFMHYAHMNVPEAVKGFEELGARFFIPTQWGTFHLGQEPAGFPGLDLKRHIERYQLDKTRFKILDIGQILPIIE